MKKLLSLILLIFLIPTTCYSFMEIECPNAVLIDASNGRVLFEQNAYTRAKPASTTKIMTAILALENLKLDDTATASSNAINLVPPDGSNANIQIGETLTIDDLLKCLFIVSGNDAANVLAEKVAGTIPDFTKMMNDKAKEIGCKDTNFVNANGLDADDHYTTAYDLALMYKYAYNKFPDFKRILKITSYTLPNTEQYNKDPRLLQSTNYLMLDRKAKDGFSYYYPNCTGGKTGFTSGAKNCIVASAENESVAIIACVLGGEQNADNSSQRFKDIISLFDYGFQRLVKKEIIHSRRFD